ncbi:hypothetical protein [Nocardioides bruguierae]|uniref:hypothetical protein n=1 Tax=Nocardioides bruguierae TaxID=2945102 RepID=UPI002020CD7C|nr:hypothetical protein [Nocardioides bruguierae]MCL8026649.1 hypothetical protein [Nocardioides bruguierae]
MTDWGALYAAVVAAVADLATETLEEQGPDALEVVVPATPAWRARDVLAHLAGVAADNVSGDEADMAGAPSPAWTARQVATRAEAPVAAHLAELRGHVPAVRALVADASRPAVVWDVCVHHADLCEALGTGRPDPALWRPVAHAVAPGLLSTVPARVTVGAAVYGAGGPEDPVLALDEYELFRGAFSRRSRRQMAGWLDGLLDADALDALCIFGPRDDDQPLPVAAPA